MMEKRGLESTTVSLKSGTSTLDTKVSFDDALRLLEKEANAKELE